MDRSDPLSPPSRVGYSSIIIFNPAAYISDSAPQPARPIPARLSTTRQTPPVYVFVGASGPNTTVPGQISIPIPTAFTFRRTPFLPRALPPSHGAPSAMPSTQFEGSQSRGPTVSGHTYPAPISQHNGIPEPFEDDEEPFDILRTQSIGSYYRELHELEQFLNTGNIDPVPLQFDPRIMEMSHGPVFADRDEDSDDYWTHDDYDGSSYSESPTLINDDEREELEHFVVSPILSPGAGLGEDASPEESLVWEGEDLLDNDSLAGSTLLSTDTELDYDADSDFTANSSDY